MVPGINTLIRELVIYLRNLYKAAEVTGVKESFQGYYKNDFVELTIDLVDKIHHRGGCYLGIATT